MDLESLAALAVRSGYGALCMRGSQVGVHSEPRAINEAARVIRAHGLRVSMVTGDFDVVYNNDSGPNCLRRIKPYVELAKTLQAPLIRVALKQEFDIPWAQRAADEAAEAGLKLVHQCHTQSLFETVSGIEETLKRIGRSNFGLVYEPANLELCGQGYGEETVKRLGPWIFNVYLQNQVIRPEGSITLKTWHRGPVPFDLIPIYEDGGIDFASVFRGLAEIGYDGPVKVHQAQAGDQRGNESVEMAAQRTASFLSDLGRRFGLIE